MKQKILTAIAVGCLSISSFAQNYYQDYKNPDTYSHSFGEGNARKELFLPQVNGYNVYKADLHTHTIFSDGQVLPEYRVKEAWLDGLDVLAITEHIEHRPHEATFVDYLARYRDEKYDKAKNHRGIGYKPLDKDGIMIDLNYSVRIAQKEGKKYGLTIIPGTEITRSGDKIGHFNALFTTDNNLLFDINPVQAIRKAKEHGAIVMHNHPGWARTSVDYTKYELEAYNEGLIDGVEVMNTAEFYPKIIDRAKEKGLFISANTDIHGTIANEYGLHGYRRPMTLILAKDKSLESIREALLDRRTIAMAFNTLCGDAKLLEDFFRASVKIEFLHGNSNIVMLTNTTAIPYYIKCHGKNQILLGAFTSVLINFGKKADDFNVAVLNAWVGEKENLIVSVK